jgi:Protein of unknown function (DUF_B2219)
MSKTQTLATNFAVALVLLHTPAWGQSTPMMYEIGAMAPAAAPVELATEPVTVQVAMTGDTRAQIEPAMAPSSKTKLTLKIEGIKFDSPPGVLYEVYINLPKNEEPNYKSAYFVGNLSFFVERHAGAAEHPYVARFDITKNVRELKALKLWNDAEISVTFVMRGLVDREGRPLPVSPGVRARFDNIKVTAITPQ